MDIAYVRTDDEWEELVALIDTVFGRADAELWQNFHGREPFCRREWCKIVKIGGRIASHICWVPRLMRIGSAVVRAGAIGYTATRPQNRRQGLAAALMRDWTRELTERGEHLSFLTGIPRFYEPFGYEFCFPLDLRDSAVCISPDQLPPAGEGMGIRRYRESDLPALMALYDRENAGRTGSLVRTRDYWEWLLHGLQAIGRIGPEDIWLIENSHGPVGYAMLRSGPLGELEIYESAVTGEKAASALLDAVAARARSEASARIDLKLPLDHAVTRYALSRGAHLTGYSYGMYARILDLPGLFEALQPELERRLRSSSQSEWKGTLHLLTDIGAVNLAIAQGRIEVGKEIEPVHSVQIPQAMLVKLVTGYTSVHWVAGALNVQWAAGLSSAHIERAVWPILQALFPKGCPYIWNADTGY